MPASTNIISFVLLFLLEFPLGSLLIHYVGRPEVKELIQILIWQRIKHPSFIIFHKSNASGFPRAAAHNDMRQASEAAGKYTVRASVPRWDSYKSYWWPYVNLESPPHDQESMLKIWPFYIHIYIIYIYHVCNKLSIYYVFAWNQKDSTRFFLEVFSQLSQKWKALQWIVMTHARP